MYVEESVGVSECEIMRVEELPSRLVQSRELQVVRRGAESKLIFGSRWSPSGPVIFLWQGGRGLGGNCKAVNLPYKPTHHTVATYVCIYPLGSRYQPCIMCHITINIYLIFNRSSCIQNICILYNIYSFFPLLSFLCIDLHIQVIYMYLVLAVF